MIRSVEVLATIILLVEEYVVGEVCYISSYGQSSQCKYSCCTIAGRSGCCNMEGFIIGGVIGGLLCVIIGFIIVLYACFKTKTPSGRQITVRPSEHVFHTRIRHPIPPRGPPPPYPGR